MLKPLTLQDEADAQRPARVTQGIIQFVDVAPMDATQFMVKVASEDTAAAVQFAKQTLLPRVSAGEAIALDFRNWNVFSQSYLHALLYTTIRMAWATKTPLYVLNASAPVRSGIEWVEGYALAG